MKNLRKHAMSIPLVIWSVVFIILPIMLLLFMSFMTKGPLGRIVYDFTFENYARISEPVYFQVVKQSLIIAGYSTLLTVGLGYPFAYYIATRKPVTGGKLILLMVIPFWANELVLAYSFVILFNSSGVINTLFMNLGLINEPLELLYNNFAVVTGMIYMLLPFAVMPMYSSIEKLDKGLIEASKDLGANPLKTFFRIILPLTSPGIFAGVILVFIPTIGYYMITDMLGGGTSMMIGNLIYNQFTISRNWPFGAALSMVLALLILLMLRVYKKIGGNLDDLA